MEPATHSSPNTATTITSTARAPGTCSSSEGIAAVLRDWLISQRSECPTIVDTCGRNYRSQQLDRIQPYDEKKGERPNSHSGEHPNIACWSNHNKHPTHIYATQQWGTPSILWRGRTVIMRPRCIKKPAFRHDWIPHPKKTPIFQAVRRQVSGASGWCASVLQAHTIT